jgi:hypothetical protein
LTNQRRLADVALATNDYFERFHVAGPASRRCTRAAAPRRLILWSIWPTPCTGQQADCPTLSTLL